MDLLLPVVTFLLLLPLFLGVVLFRRYRISSLILLLIFTSVYLTGFYAGDGEQFIPVQGATERDWNHQTFWYEPWGRSGVHKGIDIFAKKQQPIIASTGGIVLYAGEVGMGGNILLVLGRGWKLHYYAHLHDVLVPAGMTVDRGEKIASVGDTGNAKGKPPHLHYSVVRLFPDLTRFDSSTQGWKKIWFLDPGALLSAP